MQNIFDTHAHYDDERFESDRDETLRRMKNGGVSHIINCGCDEKSSAFALSLADKYDFVYAAVGIHPENITSQSEDELSAICRMAHSEKAVAIGEIGLDYYWDDSAKEKQKEIFIRQIIMANELEMPVIIHDREAHADTLEILEKYRPQGVLHCFSGSAETALQILKLGMYIGFGGSLTFKNAKKAVSVAEIVPLERILLETDCPYMAPVPMRGKRNESVYIEYVAERLAQIKGVSAQEVIDTAAENAVRLFKIK